MLLLGLLLSGMPFLLLLLLLMLLLGLLIWWLLCILAVQAWGGKEMGAGAGACAALCDLRSTINVNPCSHWL